jgi:hypothetical protein
MSKLGPDPSIHPTASVRDSRFGAYTEVGARTVISETVMGDYSYIVQDGQIDMSTIGKFCSIASHVRINPGNHPMERASQSHFLYRASRYFDGEPDEAGFFDWRRSHAVTIGHDVWIGHGGVVLAGKSCRHGRRGGGGRHRDQGRRALHGGGRQSGAGDQASLSRGGRRAAGGARLVGLGPRTPATGIAGFPHRAGGGFPGEARRLRGVGPASPLGAVQH